MDTDPPPELATAPRDALMAYARTLALAVAASPSLATSLALPPPRVRAAYTAAWDAAAAEAAAAAAAPPEWALAFTHACDNVGCREPACPLCAHNPARACAVTLAPKCLAGDALRAACGADVRVELVHLPTLTVLDGRAYDALLAAGRGGDAAAVAGTAVATNKAGDPILAGGRALARSPATGAALLRGAGRGGACVPLVDVSVTGSSESLLSGQRPPFRLCARAVAASTGAALRGVAIAVSDPFVVATPRVRSAVKADVPVVTDHVSKLNAVGPQTVAKLADVAAAAAAAGLPPLPVPVNKVTTVGEFRDLVVAAAGDAGLTDGLKKALKLTKGWDAAADHAASAVETDDRARVWWKSGTEGLAFRAALGAVDLAHPLALVARAPAPSPTVAVTPLARLASPAAAAAAADAAAAAAAWGVARHPGWAAWDGVDSDALAAKVAAAGASAAPIVLPAPTAPAGRGGHGLLGPPPPRAPTAPPAAATGANKRAVPASPFEVTGAPPPPTRPARGGAGSLGVNPSALQAHLSSLLGRPLTGGDMARLVPSFPAVSAGDDIFLTTGLSALEFSKSELAKMDAWAKKEGAATVAAAASAGASAAASSAAAPADAAGPANPDLLRFLADRLTAAPGSGGYGAAAGEARPSGLEAFMSGAGLSGLLSLPPASAAGGGGGGGAGATTRRPAGRLGAPQASEAPATVGLARRATTRRGSDKKKGG